MKFLDKRFTLDDFEEMEIYLLRFYEWKISHPTAIHFIDFYLHFAALGENHYIIAYKIFQDLSYVLLGLSLQGTVHLVKWKIWLNTDFS